jgi:hypothetical protein
MKLAAKLFLALSHASHFGVGSIALLPKTKPVGLTIDMRKPNENREPKSSRMKTIANACSWLD